MSEWISVKDRLPECGMPCLGVNINGYMAVFNRLEFRALPPDCAPIYAIYAWLHTPEESFTTMSGVTHWQPLPEPPTT